MGRLLVFILPLIMLSSAWAAETVKVEEVVVTALRAEELVERLPANVTVITEEDIEESTATTVQELLMEQDSLIVRDLYGTGTKSTVDMRGFARGLNTAILLDGRKLNEVDLSGVEWNLIPLENIERIEIVRGGGSVLYGDNALAGVINIITKKGITLRPEIEVDARAESYDGQSEHATLRGATDRLSYFLFGKYRETDGYRENSEFRAKDLSGNLIFDITDTVYAELRGGYHSDRQGFPGGLTEADIAVNRRGTNTPDDGADTWQRYYGTVLGYASDWGGAELAYDFNSREFDSFIFGGNIKRDTDMRELKGKVTLKKDILGHKSLLVAGVDYRKAQADNTSDFALFDAVVDVEKTETGFYIQEEFFITDRLSATGGYRYTEARFEDEVSGVSFGFPFSGSGLQKFYEDSANVGLNYNYAEGAKVFAGYSKGYRLPTTDELFDYQGNVVFLKPEKSQTLEAGVVHPFGDRLRVSATFYHMKVDDELYYNQSAFENQNLEETEHQGVELGFDAKPAEFVSLRGSWTHTRAKFESGQFSGNFIPMIPRHTASLGATFRIAGAFRLAVDATWVGKRYIDNDLDNTLPQLDDYATVDARLSYTHKFLTAYVGVNNLFDEEYNDYGAVGSSGRKEFYPAPEINYYGGIKAVF